MRCAQLACSMISFIGLLGEFMDRYWLPLVGNLQVSGDQILFLPKPILESASATASPLATDAVKQPPQPHGVVRASGTFEQGKISMQVKLNRADAKCHIGVPVADGHIYAGLNCLGAAYGFGLFKDNNWQPKGGNGTDIELPVGVWIDLVLQIRGSTLSLFVNGVFVLSVTQQTQRGAIDLFFQSLDAVSVKSIRVESNQAKCFIVMQFTDEFDVLYRDVIKPICERFRYEVLRADDFHTSGMIIDDVTRSIRECSLVIADITPDNPNVFYEVGYAHAIDKPTILLSNKLRGKLPFDVAGVRTIFYDNTIGGKLEVEERLIKHLEAIKDLMVSREV
jgi:DNA-binding cell septation regulator SpoVG